MRLFFINLLVFMGLVVGMHLAAMVYLWALNKQDLEVSEKNLSGFIIADPEVGFHGNPGFEGFVDKEIDGELIYNVEYSFDQNHRRENSKTWVEPAAKSFVFLGDSNLFGQGVPADETLPYHFGRKHPQYRTYNYAFQGWGPSNVMALAESGRLKREIPEPEGVVFYFYMASHADRLLGTTAFFRWSQGQHPYYHWQDGRWARRGTFKEAVPWRVALYSALARSTLNHLFQINWPNSYSAGNFPKVCAHFPFIRDHVKTSLPNHRFVTVFWLHLSGRDPELAACLQQHQMEFVNISQKIPARYRHHPLDSHLNALGQAFFAKKLQEALVAQGLIGESVESP